MTDKLATTDYASLSTLFRHVDLDSLRRAIAIVPQDTVLFHSSIMHNINYGDLSAGREQVEEAARIAELHHSILSWPSGYDTQVGILPLIK